MNQSAPPFPNLRTGAPVGWPNPSRDQTGGHISLGPWLIPIRLSAIIISALLLLPGCALPQLGTRALTPAYRPQNVFLWNAALSGNIQRVAVLPMACDQNTPELVDGKDALEPIVSTELAKLRKFEIMHISPEALRSKTGQLACGAEDALPRELFPWLVEGCGCDAVLFCKITVFRGFAPLAVGWRMRLVDLRTHATLWASDEVFDASQPSVQAGARRYQVSSRQSSTEERWVMENSPRRFAQYAAAQLLATLPGL